MKIFIPLILNYIKRKNTEFYFQMAWQSDRNGLRRRPGEDPPGLGLF
jgi:hypothetical protein